MKTFVHAVALFVVCACPSFAWTASGHQTLGWASVFLASNDIGQDFAAARALLEANRETFLKAVIGPDTDPKLIYPPLFPPLLHGHEAMLHVGFGGLEKQDSELLVKPYCLSAVRKFNQGDIPGAIHDLGCVLHLVHDAGFCGHSNFLNAPAWWSHSSFENWVDEQTTAGGNPKPYDMLHEDAWVVGTGGVYLKESWCDDKGKEHWAGELEAWVDVAAHLSCGLLDSSTKKHDNCDFQGAAHQQFVVAQRCGAGMLLDFFQRVGVVPEPVFYFKRADAVWRFRLGDNESQRLGQQGELCPADFWPTTSPDGKSRLFYLDSRTKEPGQSDFGVKVGDHSWGWDFSRTRWPSAPAQISQAFYVNNCLIALVDASEGDDWQHLYLVPAVPAPDVWYDCPKGSVQYFYDSQDDLWSHHIQRIDLP